MPITKTKHVHVLWQDNQKVTRHELKQTLKRAQNWLHIWGVMLIFLFQCCVSTFLLLLKKLTSKNHSSFLYRLQHATLVLFLTFYTVLCCSPNLCAVRQFTYCFQKSRKTVSSSWLKPQTISACLSKYFQSVFRHIVYML